MFFLFSDRSKCASLEVAANQSLEALRALCEPVPPPRDLPAYHRFFCGSADADNKAALKEAEPKKKQSPKPSRTTFARSSPTRSPSIRRTIRKCPTSWMRWSTRREGALAYKAYLDEIVELARKVKNPSSSTYPPGIDTLAKQALFDNLGDANLAIVLNDEILRVRPDGSKDSQMKQRIVRRAIANILKDNSLLDAVFELAKAQSEY